MIVPILLLTLAGSPQESTRTLDKPGAHTKHLTVDTVDRWLLDGVADEVLRIDVRSDEFDPVLELVRLDAMANAHVRVTAEVGDVLVPRGASVREALDPKGISLEQWRGCYTAQRSGEHYLRVQGEPRPRFRVGLAPVPRRELALGAPRTATVDARGLDEWVFETKTGGLHLVVVEDPACPMAPGPATAGRIPVGASDSFAFGAEPGQVLRASVTSDAFDPVLKLYDELGAPLIEVDDTGGAGRGKGGTYQLRVLDPDR